MCGNALGSELNFCLSQFENPAGSNSQAFLD